MNTLEIFRVEQRETKRGCEYTASGVYEPLLMNDGSHVVPFPMPHREEYREDDIEWFACCGSLEDIKKLFNEFNALFLVENDFRLVIFEVAELGVRIAPEGHLKFDRTQIKSERELNLLETIAPNLLINSQKTELSNDQIQVAKSMEELGFSGFN